MTSPLVSVVLSVKNGAADLPHAVESILAQTFTDFELIVLNDGSTDDTAAVLDRMVDARVRRFHQDNMGLAGSLNRGIALARGRYIARQDHDDRASATRLARQVEFLEGDPDCALVGTRAEIWVGNRSSGRTHDHPTDDATLRFELLFDNPFVHSSVMLRKSALDAVGSYCTDPARQPPEDYELWSRLARRYRVANLAERLTIYREMPQSLSRNGKNPFRDKVIAIAAENLAAAAGESAPGRDHRDIAALAHGAYRQLSSHPDIESMCRVVQEAGRRIHASAPAIDLPHRVAVRIKRLRREYDLYASGLYRLRPIVGFARRAFAGW